MIPAFNSDGNLPVGVHWSDSWAEIEDRFGTNGHRQRLLAGMFRGFNLLEIAGCEDVYIDGSFTTTKEFPKDFDVCWETAGVDFKLLDPVFRDHSNQRAAQKARFFGEFLPVTLAEPIGHPRRAIFELFQRDKQTQKPKGIVGFHLGN